jgi:hypothetical protein
LAAPSRLGAIIIVTVLSFIALGAAWGIVIYLLPQSEGRSHPWPIVSVAPPPPSEREGHLQLVGPERRHPEPTEVPTVVRQAGRPPEDRMADRAISDQTRWQPGLDLKCDAEVEMHCPDQEDGSRRICIQDKLRQFSVSCQPVLRERMVRVKETLLHLRAACEEDAKQFCRHVIPGGGALIQCLEEHAQEVSDSCFRLLPKRGRLAN